MIIYNWLNIMCEDTAVEMETRLYISLETSLASGEFKWEPKHLELRLKSVFQFSFVQET